MKKGDFFGSYSFLTNNLRELSVRSISVSHLACLTKQKFLEVIQDFPGDFVNN